jgi:hypothetical protein
VATSGGRESFALGRRRSNRRPVASNRGVVGRIDVDSVSCQRIDVESPRGHPSNRPRIAATTCDVWENQAVTATVMVRASWLIPEVLDIPQQPAAASRRDAMLSEALENLSS